MRLALIGGGGLAKEMAEVAVLAGYHIIGYYSDRPVTDRWNYLGDLDSAEQHSDDIVHAFCIGAVNAAGVKKRSEIINRCLSRGVKFINLISPKAVISEGVGLGVGVFLAHGVVLSVDSYVDDFTIVNTSAVIGHDANVGRNSIIAPLAFLGGSAKIGSDVLIGPNASVLEGREVGSGSIIGTSACVYRDVKPGSTVMPVITKTLR